MLWAWSTQSNQFITKFCELDCKIWDSFRTRCSFFLIVLYNKGEVVHDMSYSRDIKPLLPKYPASTHNLLVSYGKMPDKYKSSGREKRPECVFPAVSESMPNLKQYLPRKSFQSTGNTSSQVTSRMSSNEAPPELPKSVRNAPKELRAAIRRRQNNESARRNREKRREEHEQMERQYIENQQRINELERRVEEISSELHSTNESETKRKNSSTSNKKQVVSSSIKQREAQTSSEKNFYGVPF